jgi:hypothetical protein
MHIRIAPDGTVNGFTNDLASFAQLPGHSFIDVGNTNVPTKTVVRTRPKQKRDDFGSLMFNQDQTPIYETQPDPNNPDETIVVIESYNETISLDKEPSEFTASEVNEFIRQAKIDKITDKYLGDPNGIITKLRQSFMTAQSEGKSTTVLTAITNQILAKKTSMSNEIKAV